MKHYILNLIPKLKQFSENLDRKEVFCEFPWVIIDENLNQQKYIFKKDGSLIMSLNGAVTIGKWEYLSAAKSLLIDRITDKILLNQNFIAPAVMVLKKDGLKDDNFILVNQQLLPNLNAQEYLQKLYYEKNNIVVKKLKTGQYLELNNYKGYPVDAIATINGVPVEDATIHVDTDKKYQIKNSKVAKVLVDTTYNTNKGIISIEQTEFFAPAVGDLVFQNDQLANDGKYRLGFLNSITVKDGRIIK